ncbi:hypothetical protein PAXRUDRAFT_333578 [Paxillus rubicundulus Ve08.2h10]|uniref:Uncharacterized protein n=1 Tax=Paxillus rubicundulus Ve08.2h10 TaxID=930991 RepID=A0A0D0CSF4_9AGAM|nr:hypothetical protein PAXRUDRAFT_333578 [Paxillus rubicundulus Ve08.2h10]
MGRHNNENKKGIFLNSNDFEFRRQCNGRCVRYARMPKKEKHVAFCQTTRWYPILATLTPLNPPFPRLARLPLRYPRHIGVFLAHASSRLPWVWRQHMFCRHRKAPDRNARCEGTTNHGGFRITVK